MRSELLGRSEGKVDETAMLSVSATVRYYSSTIFDNAVRMIASFFAPASKDFICDVIDILEARAEVKI